MSAKWTIADIPSQRDRIALITGANSGLGFETSVALAQAGATVVMACRNPAKAQSALEELRQRVPQAQADMLALDLADLGSVRTFAATVRTRYPRLDLLCNNAGVMALPFQKTRDGFEMQIGTNHLGPFLLTGLLLESLKAAPAARIVNVASIAHKAAKNLPIDNLNWEQGPYSKSEAYARSKLANLLFTFELNQRLRIQNSRVIAVAAHPGYASTRIGDGATAGNWLKALAMQLGNWLIAQPADQGALPSLYAATMPGVEGGDYYGPDGWFEFRGYPVKVTSRPTARDPQAAAALWALSEKLTGTSFL